MEMEYVPVERPRVAPFEGLEIAKVKDSEPSTIFSPAISIVKVELVAPCLIMTNLLTTAVKSRLLADPFDVLTTTENAPTCGCESVIDTVTA